ncbi:MAG: hypothetical protein KDA80_11010, partial [Planctomycetaceae bacterium]|nr:hypothetical protein [Planctomycetaceae bacterium]
MIRWLRVVLPTNYLLGAGLLFLLLAGIPVLARLAFMREVAFPLEDPAGLGLIGMLAAAYGVYRVAAYHPIYQKEYREWLERTPWRFGLPLPLGPVHLVLQDLVPLAILLGLALLFEQFEWRHAPALFAGPYLLALMAA